ncbi:MAG TPA: hypothetical protein VIK37_02450 [Candidatus Saccharimonadales bacterium]
MYDTQNNDQQSPRTTTVDASPSTVVAGPYVASRRPAGSRLDSLLEWVFRVGLASVFIINSITAIFQPGSFRGLLENNFVGAFLGHYQLLLYVIAVNDLFLGLLLLSGVKKKYVYAWAGIWLAIVSFFKLTALIS